jgi:hypothetical protein
VESGDVDALFAAGMIALSWGGPGNGAAVVLATCELGRDCSADNPDNGLLAACVISGNCPVGTDIRLWLQSSMDAAQYSEVDARAQVIKQAFQSGDWDTVMESLRMELARSGFPRPGG